MAIYATYITNYYGYQLKKATKSEDKKRIRTEYSKRLLAKLKLEIKVINPQNIPKDGQYLLASNHRSVIDPLIIEVATQNSAIFGHWISKKELYNSFFFGLFVRNAGTILVNRDKANQGEFFANIKSRVTDGDSIYIFPEGTRSKKEGQLGEFQGGSQLIALKNRLNILPVHIKTDADKELLASLKDGKSTRVIEIEFGNIIEYKDRSDTLENMYKKQFNL